MESLAQEARIASRRLAALSTEARNSTLEHIIQALHTEKGDILQANQQDVAKCDPSSPLGKRLILDEKKFTAMIESVAAVMNLDDPVGKVTLKTELAEGLILDRISCPIGVLLTIYEARPEAGVQIASLALKSGNALIIKGGKEAAATNAAIYKAITRALAKASADFGVPIDALKLVETRDQVAELLKLDKYIDLVIPRGSNALVRNIKESTKIPVLGHADGICHIYVDDQVSDLEKAVRIMVDAKTQYPAGCNAVETFIVHEDIASKILPLFAVATERFPVKFYADEAAEKWLPSDRTTSATNTDWATEYLDYIVAVKTVKDISEAIAHINKYGSGHTDCILTDSEVKIERFQLEVDSAGVYANCSTRFADGFRYGFGAEVGISTNRIHSRGPVGLEGLLLYKYRLRGDGHCVGEVGDKWAFTHRKLL